MKTKRTKVEGTCYIWALPKTDWETQQEIDKVGIENVVPFNYKITAHSTHYAIGAVKICEFDVIGTVPEGVDLIQAAVKTLREEIDEVQKEAKQKVDELNERIRKLAMITYQPEPDDDVIEA